MMGWPPRWLTPVSEREVAAGDGELWVEFASQLCRCTKDTLGAQVGQKLEFRPWQAELAGNLLARRADGRLRHRVALIGLARKNGKSTLGSTLGMFGLLTGPRGGEVYSIAADKDQARITFDVAKKMVELEPALSAACRVRRDAIEVISTGSLWRVLSSEAYTKEGLNPHLVIADEVHAHQTRELWDTLALACGARVEPLMVGITTAGVRTDISGQDSICYQLYQHGQRVASGETADPSFFMAWWEPPSPTDDHRESSTWAPANPGMGDLVSVEDLSTNAARMPENEFRTKRCNQWVAVAQAWLPTGLWDSLTEVRSVPPGAEVVLAFDGSFSGDSTGLTVHEVGTCHIDVVGLWEKPLADDWWRVDPDEVETVVRSAFDTWKVRHLVYDRRIWQQLFERLLAEGYPCEAMPQGQLMINAAQKFYEACADKKLSHSGDPRLTRHLRNTVAKPTPAGWRISKERPDSPRKIDLAVAAVMGHSYAAVVEPAYDPLANIF